MYAASDRRTQVVAGYPHQALPGDLRSRPELSRFDPWLDKDAGSAALPDSSHRRFYPKRVRLPSWLFRRSLAHCFHRGQCAHNVFQRLTCIPPFQADKYSFKSSACTIYISCFADHRKPFDLDQRLGLKETCDLEQRHRRVVAAEVLAEQLPDRLKVGAICVAVGDEDIQFDDILHRTARRADDGVQIVQHLGALPNQVARRDDVSSSIAGILAGQKQQLAAAGQNAVIEAARRREFGRVDNHLLHERLRAANKEQRTENKTAVRINHGLFFVPCSLFLSSDERRLGLLEKRLIE